MNTLSGIGYACVCTLARILPDGVCYLLGETLGVLCFLFCRKRRRNLVRNLRVALGPRASHVNMTGLRVMLNFGRSVAEVFMIPHLGKERVRARVSIIGKEHLDAIVSTGRGVVLVTAHLGSWELGGVALASTGYKITTVAGTQFTGGLSPFIRAVKERCGIGVVSADGGTLSILRALRRGELVALHIDGDQYFGGLVTDLFGRKTVLPRGPAGLSVKTGAAVVPAFAVRTARSKITVFIEDEIPIGGQDESGLTRRIVSVLEDYITRYADQWCMFRPIWETDQ